MKKLFYYTDALPFLAKKEKAIKKLKRNLDLFRESSSEIELVWHPWSKTDAYLELNHSPVTDEYRSIVADYKAEGWGTLDETATLAVAREALLTCDTYYGDMSDLVQTAENLGIPVMLQSIEII